MERRHPVEFRMAWWVPMHVVAMELVDGVRVSIVGVHAVVRAWYLVLHPRRNCLEEHEMLVL